MAVPILTIFAGALGAAGGVQELVVQGIMGNQLVPLIGGTAGAVASSLMLVAGIALLRQAPRAGELARAAGVATAVVTLLIGTTGWGLAGWPVTLLGLLWPLVLWRYTARSKLASAEI